MTKLPLVALEDALRTLPDTLGRSGGELRVRPEHRRTEPTPGSLHEVVPCQQDSDIDVLVSFDGPATSERYFGVQFFLEDLLGRS